MQLMLLVHHLGLAELAASVASEGTRIPPLSQQTLGHMQLMLGYSTAPEYVRGFANVIMAGVNGYNATAADGTVTNVYDDALDPETLLTVWGLRSFVSMPNVFAQVRTNSPGWRETIASWGRRVRPLADRGIIVGVFVGDESCSNFACPFSNISAIVDAVRDAVGGGGGRPPWIYDNEQGPWNPTTWGLSRWPYIPDNMDLISFDFYYPDAGPQEAEACRKNYEQYLYPKLRDHQRVMLVPYTAGCDPAVCFATKCADPNLCPAGHMDCPMDIQAANNVQRLQGYFDWALYDSRVAGFHPWHILNSSSTLWPGYCDQRLGAVWMPPVMEALCRIGRNISGGPSPCAPMPALPPAPAPGTGGEPGYLVPHAPRTPRAPWPPPPQWSPHQAIKYFGSTYVVIEGENLTVAHGWTARRWGEGNYFSDTTMSFMNRKAYLHLPAKHARKPSSVATANVHIPDAGNYLFLARYEALERFDTPFRVTIEQNGKLVLDHVYGLTTNLKIWANERRGTPGCNPLLNRVCQFVCGPEALVWEGLSSEHPKATLVEGRITVTISSVPAANHSVPLLGDVNLDTMIITRNETDAWLRLEQENGTLPLDGLLTQAGEVYAVFRNIGNVSLNFTVPSSIPKAPSGQAEGSLTNPVTQTIGAWTGLKSGCGWATQGDNGGCPHVAIAPGETSPVVYVGELFSSLNDGSWNVPQQLGQGNLSLPGAQFEVTLSVDCRHRGIECGFVQVGSFVSEAGGVSIEIDANMIATRRARKSGTQLFEIVEQLQGLDSTLHQGRFPALAPVYATTFGAYSHRSGGGPSWPGAVQGPVDWWGWRRTDLEWVRALTEWQRMMPLTSGNPTESWGRIVWDVGQSNEGDFSLETANKSIQQLLAMPGIDPRAVLVGNLGDEIHLLRPEQRLVLNQTDDLFHRWARTKQLQPTNLGCENWETCHYMALVQNPGAAHNHSQANAHLYYYSNLFAHDWGLSKIANATALTEKLLPAALAGANLPSMCESPTGMGYVLKNGSVHTNSYLGLTYTYIRSFRESALTLPWSEDWCFGPPVGTQQMTALLIDAFRSGVRDRGRPPLLSAKPRTADSVWSGSAPIMMYTMLHSPGQTAKGWRRQLFSDLMHGVKLVNLFSLLDAPTAPGPDYVGLVANGISHYREARVALNELGNFDDIVMHGKAQAAGRAVAILFSETGDIWHDMWGTAGAAKRALYIALKHRQLAVDVVTEQDLESVDVMANYEVVYMVDSHIATPAAHALIAWIYSGGTLVSMVHGGMRDEADAPSELASVFGVTATKPAKAGVINFIKRDIHAVPKLDSATVNWLAFPDSWQEALDHDVIEEDRTQAVVGEQSHCSWATPTQVVATYADSTAAATLRMHGKGIAFWVGWHPGLAYFIDAIPNRPADKGNTDANFNHFVPTQFNNAARELLAMPALASTTDSVPVVVSENLVESGVIDADGLGIAIVLVNWSAQTELLGLTVTLAFDVPWFTDATLASGRSVVMSRVPHPHAARNSTLAGFEAYRFTLDLQMTDAIILRKTGVRAVT